MVLGFTATRGPCASISIGSRSTDLSCRLVPGRYFGPITENSLRLIAAVYCNRSSGRVYKMGDSTNIVERTRVKNADRLSFLGVA